MVGVLATRDYHAIVRGHGTVKIRDRIKELRRVKASELLPHPANWRTHPESQMGALRGLLAEIGFVGAVLVRETPDGLQILDGHARADLAGDALVPCLVLDVTEAEARTIIGTFDPIGVAAEADKQKLGELLAEIETESKAVQALLDGLAAENGIDLFDSSLPPGADGKEFDESCADDVKMTTCPKCGHEFPT